MSNLEKLLKLADECPVGSPVDYKGLKAEVLAYSDEHVFLKVPEIACTPEQFDGSKDHKVIRDREVANLRSEVYSLREEMERLLLDPSYFAYRQDRELRRRNGHNPYRRAMEPSYTVMPGEMMGDLHTLPYTGRGPDAMPIAELWVDPLMFKQPTQQKRG